jgi:hypothetical protein
MSLKAVELQITIPRTHDAGKIQEQLQQRPLNDQAHLSNEQRKEIEKQQHVTSELEKTEKEKIKDQSKQNQSNSNQHQNNSKNESKKKKTQHPYKGQKVDISL